MPLPALAAILPGLQAAAAGLGIGAGAYGLGKAIKGGVEQGQQKKLAAAQQKNFMAQQKKFAGQAGHLAANPNQGGFIPAARQGGFWGGNPAGVETYNMYTPQQQQAFNSVLQQALSGLGKNQFDFAPIEAQARRGFAEQTIPGIAERFSKLGAQKSSAFGQQLGAAGAGLESDLAALKSNYGLQQQQQLHNLLGIGLQPQFESLYRPGSEGFGQSLLRDLLGGALNGQNIGAVLNGLKGLGGAGNNPNNQNGLNDAAQQANNAAMMANQAQMNNLGQVNLQQNPNVYMANQLMGNNQNNGVGFNQQQQAINNMGVNYQNPNIVNALEAIGQPQNQLLNNFQPHLPTANLPSFGDQLKVFHNPNAQQFMNMPVGF